MQTKEQTPCCNAAAVMGRTAKQLLAEKDADIADLRADLECKDGRIRNLHDEIESLGEAIKTKNARIAALESRLANQEMIP